MSAFRLSCQGAAVPHWELKCLQHSFLCRACSVNSSDPVEIVLSGAFSDPLHGIKSLVSVWRGWPGEPSQFRDKRLAASLFMHLFHGLKSIVSGAQCFKQHLVA